MMEEGRQATLETIPVRIEAHGLARWQVARAISYALADGNEVSVVLSSAELDDRAALSRLCGTIVAAGAQSLGIESALEAGNQAALLAELHRSCPVLRKIAIKFLPAAAQESKHPAVNEKRGERDDEALLGSASMTRVEQQGGQQ